MSLMGTLGKVAMGVIVAKGVGKVMGGAGGAGGGLGGLLGGLTGGSGGSAGGGLGGLLGGLTGGNNAQAGSGGGLGGLLGGLTGGSQGGGQSGGLGDMLGGLMGGNNAQAGNQANAGGLGGLLAGLAGGQAGGAAAGGLGGLLGSLGGATAPQPGSSTPDFGSMFNDALQGKEPEQVSQTDEENAAILLRAMISAAKADGQLDSEEQRKITEHLGDVSEEEAAFVRNELQAPLDLDGLVASVPSGLEQQVYLMSLMAIDLDSKEEAVYLDSLRKGLNITEQVSNQIHEKLGAPQLYA